ncbi:MAG: hypothetical protein JST16_01765 [Bdellovibrionales bacterium]|nr:hypothetical protein [Bdellovibrionales bacterium]
MNILFSMLNQLGINESFFVMLIMFTATYFFVAFVALNKLTKTLVEREKRTEGRESKAGHLHRDLESLREKVKISVQESRIQANADFLEIRGKAVEQQRSIVNAARESASAELKKTRASIAQQVAAEMTKLESEIPKISKAIVDKVLSSSTSSSRGASASLVSEAE